MQNYASIIAQELNIRPQQTEAVIRLLDEDATVPFIARYRKEATGSLDEVAVTAIRDRLAALKELDKRREAILASLEERGLLTPELRAKVEAADALTVLEDIYLPYRPKRRTRASMAKERGLEPLADQLARQDRTLPEAMAAAYVDAEKGVPDAEAALAGARDILAERFAEDQPARERLRKLFGREGLMRTKPFPARKRFPTPPSTATISRGTNPPRKPLPTASSPCSGAKRKASCASPCAPAMRSRRRTFWPASSSATTAPAGAKCAQPRWTATAASRARAGDRTPQPAQTARRRRIHPRVRRKPAPASACPAPRRSEHPRRGPRFPHRLQNRLPQP